MGRGGGRRAGGVVHRHQAAVAGRARARQRAPYRGGLPAPRLAHLEAGRQHRHRHADHRPQRRERHRLLVGGDRRVPHRPARPCVRLASRCCPGPRHPEAAGTTPWGGALLGAGAGDNAAAALGLAAVEGDVVVSIGTSGVVTGVAGRPVRDPTGTVAGFADATGLFLPLVATLNAARVLDAAARLLGVDHADSPSLPSRRRPERAAWSWCPTWRASARPTCPTPPAHCTG